MPDDNPSKPSVLISTKPIIISQEEAAFFWQHTTRHVGECWYWNLALDSDGYGTWGNRRAHRVAYVLANGQIPDGYTIDHTCGTRSCVNPAHLEAVTISENLARRGRHPSGERRKRNRTAARYAVRRTRGLCVQCNTPSEKYRCDRCREIHNERNKGRKR